MARLSARDVLCAQAGRTLARDELQAIGRQLEATTGGRWLADALSQLPAEERSVVDSVRTVAQLVGLRDARPPVTLIFLDAEDMERARRFALRQDPIDSVPYKEASSGDPDDDHDVLRAAADLVIDTSGVSAARVLELVVKHLGGLSEQASDPLRRPGLYEPQDAVNGCEDGSPVSET